MEFDPRNVNGYSVEEIKDFIRDGHSDIELAKDIAGAEQRFAKIQKCGLQFDKQDEIKKWLADLKSLVEKDKKAWQVSQATDTISAYEFYLNNFGWDTAIHAYEAKMRIEALRQVYQQRYEDLFEDMREDMMKYKANVMNYLFGKMPATEAMRNTDSPIGRFLKADMKLTFQDLYNSGILPEGNRALEKAIFMDDFEVPQLPIEELGEVPTDRTDVYFLGCPASGKSCVLAGFLNYLRLAGEMQYMPMRNSKGVDGCLNYFNALIKGVSEYKAPRSTGRDTVSFMQLNLGPKRDREITAMELSGEAFKELSDANVSGPEIWNQLGVGRCLRNDNPKTLFFLLDYSSIIGKNPAYSDMDQAQILENALRVLSSDGTGRHYEKGCTMSKVRTVAIVITKSDLMDVEEGRPLSREERADIAFDYLTAKFKNFMNDLSTLCKKNGINANNKGHAYEPFVTTFSLGQFFLGNSVIFDPTDSKRIGDFVVAATEKKRRGFLDFLSL